MSNEIKGVTGTLRQVSEYVASVRSGRGVGASAGVSSAGVDPLGDSVALTQKVATLRAIEAQLAGIPVVDVQRVSDIRLAMGDGGYSVAHTVVAEKLVEFEYMRHANVGAPE